LTEKPLSIIDKLQQSFVGAPMSISTAITLGMLTSVLAITFAPSSAAQTPSPTHVVSEADYVMPGQRRLIVHSEKVGRDFAITVTTPPAYGAYVGMPTGVSSGHRFPAIYVLDSGYGVAGSVAQMMTGAGIIEAAYVVSIGYPDGQPNQRNTDYLHRTTVRDGQTLGGGGAAFQAFLTDELRPLLEARFALDSSKAILFGHSFGGLFAANTLAASPKAFSGYIIGSASMWADPTLADRLKTIAAQGDGRRVFIAAGGAEEVRMVEATNLIASALSGAGSTFKIEKRIFAGEGHINYYPQLVPAAYEWLLPPTAQRIAVTLPRAAMDRLVGDYLVADGRVVGITFKDAKLHIQISGVPGQTELKAETTERFFIPGVDVTVVFEGEPTKVASGLMFSIGGTQTHAVRKAS
jgi:predicted alpha/beta superfamily hydrolase